MARFAFPRLLVYYFVQRMFTILFLHGALGILDELLICGFVIAVLLIVFLLSNIWVPKEDAATDVDQKEMSDEKA